MFIVQIQTRSLQIMKQSSGLFQLVIVILECVYSLSFIILEFSF